jgi:hypothetical protein
MSFIVIWLHFFLQAENRGKALPQKSQTLPLITQITLITRIKKAQ